MPYKRKQRKNRNRRFAGRKVAWAPSRTHGRLTSTIVGKGGSSLNKLTIGYLPRGGLPEKLYTTFTFNHTFTLTDNGSANSAVYQQYRLNSLFDPDLGANADQPYMRDQLTAFYGKAVIYGAKVKVCVMGSASTSTPHVVTMRPSMSSSAPTDAQLEIERPRCKKVCLSSQEDKGVLSHYYKIHDLFGIKKSSLEDSQHVITIGANPSKVAYLNITQSPIPINTSTATETLYYSVVIRYYCKLMDYVDQAAS